MLSPAVTRFTRLPEVCRITGLSRTHIYRLVSKGKFPKHIRLTETTTAWVEAEVQQWCEDRIAASRGGE